MASSENANPHRLVDERSIELHRAVAGALEEKPQLLDRARARVEGWLADGSVPAVYATGWKQLLALPPDLLADRLVDPGEPMRALRQCSPFAGALDPRARWRILEETNRRQAAR
jgi:hypothetical protein